MPHLLGAVALGLRCFGRTAVHRDRLHGIEALHVGFDDRDADVVGGLLDREFVDAVLHLLPLDRRAEFSAVVECHAGLDAVGARVAVAVGGLGRRVVRVSL